MRTRSRRGISMLLMVIICLAAACSALPETRPTLGPLQGTNSSLLESPTPMPTYTPTPAPLGSPERPVVMAVIASSPSGEQIQALTDLAQRLGTSLGLNVVHRVYATYLELELALQKKEAQLAWLQSVEYLLASQKGLLSASLVTNHLGVTAYGVQFIGHKDGALVPWFNPSTNQSTANASAALAQLSGLRPCLGSKSSLAGYWVPLGFLAVNNIPYLQPVETYSTSASLRTLYVKGVCDFAGTYAIAADPRSASDVVVDLTDVIDKLPILWVSPPVIPNLTLAISAEIDLTVQSILSEFLEGLARSEEGKTLLSSALNYEVAALDPLPDSAYDELRALLAVQDVRLVDLLPQNR